MKSDNPIQAKSYAFALRIVKLYRYLCDYKKELVLSKQIVRSGTGQLAAEGVKLESGLKRIPAEIIQGIPQRGTKVGVLAEELACAPLEVLGCDKPEAHASSLSSARISASASA